MVIMVRKKVSKWFIKRQSLNEQNQGAFVAIIVKPNIIHMIHLYEKQFSRYA